MTPQAAAGFIHEHGGLGFKLDAVAVGTKVTRTLTAENNIQTEIQDMPQYFRGANAGKDRAISVGRNVLGLHAMRDAQGYWCGFKVLLGESLELLARYYETFHPAGLKSVGLHYRDFVQLPSGHKPGDLAPFLAIRPEFPSQLKPRGGTFLWLSFDSPGDAAADLQMRSTALPSATGSAVTRQGLLLDWRHASAKMSKDSAGEYLSGAHRRHLGFFRLAFTEEGWNLFEPLEL